MHGLNRDVFAPESFAPKSFGFRLRGVQPVCLPTTSCRAGKNSLQTAELRNGNSGKSIRHAHLDCGWKTWCGQARRASLPILPSNKTVTGCYCRLVQQRALVCLSMRCRSGKLRSVCKLRKKANFGLSGNRCAGPVWFTAPNRYDRRSSLA